VGDERGVKVLPILREGWDRNIIINSLIVLRFLYSVGVDLLHIHFAYPYGLIGVICRLLLGLPYVITSHGWDIQIDQQTQYGARLKPRFALQIWLTLKLANAHTLVSNSMLNDAVSSGSVKKKTFVVYPGLQVDIFCKNRETEHTRLKCGGAGPLLLYLGRLVPKKGVDALIKAAPYVLRKVPNARFVIAGSGPEQRDLDKLSRRLGVDDRLTFTGEVSEQYKHVLLSKADVFIFPSRVEALGIALLEAMAYGKAIVATDIPPFREMLGPNEARFVEPNDPQGLARAVVELLRDKITREDITNRVKVKARRSSNDLMTARYEAIYKSIVKQTFNDD